MIHGQTSSRPSRGGKMMQQYKETYSQPSSNVLWLRGLLAGRRPVNKPQGHGAECSRIVLSHLGVEPSRPERCRPDPGTAHFPGALSGGIGTGFADATRCATPAPRTVGSSDLDWNSTCCHGCGNCVVVVIPSLIFGVVSVAKGRSQSSPWSPLLTSQCDSSTQTVFRGA